MPNIEPEQVGRFDDKQLKAIDQLMVEAHERSKLDPPFPNPILASR
jgi:hypothetical protein